MSSPDEAGGLDPRRMRELLIQALPEETSLHGGTPRPQHVYLPASHAKALHPNAMVVVGMRGVGKSFWWGALQDAAIRALVARLYPYAEVREETHVEVGFGEKPEPEVYPDRDTLGEMLRQRCEPRLIWRAIVTHKVAPEGHPLRTESTWLSRVRWIRDNPESVGRLLHERDQELERQQKWFLILFDALDRSADNWPEMNRLIRGLLETALDLRPYRRLRVKCFLRTDQLDESRVADFPDASKVLASNIELSWPFRDLYGMLWQYLANADHEAAEDFRHVAERRFGIYWSPIELGANRVWRMEWKFALDSGAQAALFHALAGEWMGNDRRRGYPYTWVPGHLADAYRRTSPRSFLAAIRAAAEDTRQRYPDHPRAMHYESIKRGVQVSSQIRVRELREDYPWVDDVMQPLAGLVVPCEFAQVVARWKEQGLLDNLSRRVEAGEVRLPPAHLEDGAPGVRQDLEHLGVFMRMQDDRVNIPDVFRVGYGLGRRGGVKPIQRGEEA